MAKAVDDSGETRRSVSANDKGFEDANSMVNTSIGIAACHATQGLDVEKVRGERVIDRETKAI